MERHWPRVLSTVQALLEQSEERQNREPIKEREFTALSWLSGSWKLAFHYRSRLLSTENIDLSILILKFKLQRWLSPLTA